MTLKYRIRRWMRNQLLWLEYFKNRGTSRSHHTAFTDHDRWQWEEEQRLKRMAAFKKRNYGRVTRRVSRKLRVFNDKWRRYADS